MIVLKLERYPPTPAHPSTSPHNAPSDPLRIAGDVRDHRSRQGAGEGSGGGDRRVQGGDRSGEVSAPFPTA